jgi:hypothetical protein
MYVNNSMNPPKRFSQMLTERGYSAKAIEGIWKWYDSSEKKGIASF